MRVFRQVKQRYGLKRFLKGVDAVFQRGTSPNGLSKGVAGLRVAYVCREAQVYGNGCCSHDLPARPVECTNEDHDGHDKTDPVTKKSLHQNGIDRKQKAESQV